VAHRKEAAAVLMIDRVSVGAQHVLPYHVNAAEMVDLLSLEDVDSVPKPEAIFCVTICRLNATVVRKINNLTFVPSPQETSQASQYMEGHR
jgi:hypothetical protein